MASTPGKPRVSSGIPTPGKSSSGIPTPGRFRSVSNVNSNLSDIEYVSRALADAIKANDPAQHRTSLAASGSNTAWVRAKTPFARPPSRQSDLLGRSLSRTHKEFEVGQNVRIESLGYEGTLKYIGDIDGKPGQWAGVELSGGFAGKGKNDGTVDGKRYFVCPTKCGVFVAITKLSTPTIGSGARPPSAASSRSGRITPSASWSFGSGRVTPSHSVGRITPYIDKKAVLPMSGGVTPKMKQATVPGKLPIQLQSGKLPPSPRSQPLFASLSPDCDPFTRGHPSPTVQLSPSSCSLGQNLEQMTDWPLAHNISVADGLETILTDSGLDSLQKDNATLRDTIEALRADLKKYSLMEAERDSAISSMLQMEEGLHCLERKSNEKATRLDLIERSHSQTVTELERVKVEGDHHVNDLQSKLHASEELVRSLKQAIEVKEGAEHENNALLKAKNAEITLLEGRLVHVSAESVTYRRELGAQIDELRQAGQETIALYEERLSAADSRRYDMEDQIIALQEQVKVAVISVPSNAASQRATAAEIDNEILREQVQHLQRKLSSVEDTLEDVRATAEREEASLRERMKRYKEKEDAMRNELTEGRKTVEQVLKAEAMAKSRIEEVEEALRESTFALENARAEIEVLRSDVAAADVGVNGDDPSRNLPDLSRQVSVECAQFVEGIRDLKEEIYLPQSISQTIAKTSNDESDEIKGLKCIVQELQKELASTMRPSKLLESENHVLIPGADQIRQNVDSSRLPQDDTLTSLTTPRGLIAPFGSEAEQLRKRLAEAEMKTARVTHDLTKEISELESLVESKIYREDELEREIEWLKEELSGNKRKSGAERMDHSLSRSSRASASADALESCFATGQGILPPMSRPTLELFCQDCESYGHTASECPHSLDVF